jgi:hypothetical protein
LIDVALISDGTASIAGSAPKVLTLTRGDQREDTQQEETPHKPSTRNEIFPIG